MYQNKTRTHKMLHYQTAQKPVASHDKSDLTIWKMKMFASTSEKI